MKTLTDTGTKKGGAYNIIAKGKNSDMLANFMVTAVLLVFTGLCLDMVFPINKKIWTSSYVLYTTGLAMMVLGVMMYWIELKGVRAWWTRFFDVFGKNPLFIFVLSGVWVKLYGLAKIPDGIREEIDKIFPEFFIRGFRNAWLMPTGFFCKIR